MNRYEPTHKLTRETMFTHLNGEKRIEVMRGTLARVEIRKEELQGKFKDLRVEAL
jgi:hypothetical protein